MWSAAQEAAHLCGERRAFKLCLTGGPCGGKSTAIAKLRSRLERQGFQVLVVAEVATALLSGCGGFDPAWAGTPKLEEWQRVILHQQLRDEAAFERLAALRERPAVLICDRGALDGAAFCDQETWRRVLAGSGLTAERLFGRYDLVLHLETAAAFAGGRFYEWGEGSNNEARWHSPEQAVEACRRIGEIYRGHPHYVFVENPPTFEAKMDVVLARLGDQLRLDMGLNHPRERVAVLAAPGGGLPPLDPAGVTGEVRAYRTLVFAAGRRELRRERLLYAGPPEGLATGGQRQRHAVHELREGGHGRLVSAAAAEGLDLGPATARKLAVCFWHEGRYYELIQHEERDEGGAWRPKWPGTATLDVDATGGRRAPVPPWLTPVPSHGSRATLVVPEPDAVAAPSPALVVAAVVAVAAVCWARA